MSDFIHNAAPLNGWISVKVDLPDYGQNVLLLYNNKSAKNCWIKIGCRESTDMKGEHYTGDYSHYVTHWQPLPSTEVEL